MTLGDLIFGAIFGYILLGLVWLTVNHIRYLQRRAQRKNRVRSRMPVVQCANVAGKRRQENLPPLRIYGND